MRKLACSAGCRAPAAVAVARTACVVAGPTRRRNEFKSSALTRWAGLQGNRFSSGAPVPSVGRSTAGLRLTGVLAPACSVAGAGAETRAELALPGRVAAEVGAAAEADVEGLVEATVLDDAGNEGLVDFAAVAFAAVATGFCGCCL